MSSDDSERYIAQIIKLADEAKHCTNPKFRRLFELRDSFIAAVGKYGNIDAVGRAAINLGDVALYIDFQRYPDASEGDIIRNAMTDIIRGLGAQPDRAQAADILQQVIYQKFGAS